MKIIKSRIQTICFQSENSAIFFSGLIICGKCGAHYQVCRKDERRLDGFRPSNYVCTRKRQKAICDSLNVSEVKMGPFMINYIAAMVDISQKRKKLKDKKRIRAAYPLSYAVYGFGWNSR